jgi:hypothetical protein
VTRERREVLLFRAIGFLVEGIYSGTFPVFVVGVHSQGGKRMSAPQKERRKEKMRRPLRPQSLGALKYAPSGEKIGNE